MRYALIRVLSERAKVVVIALLKFLRDRDSLPHQPSDVVLDHELFQKMNIALARAGCDGKLRGQLRLVVELTEGPFQFFLELRRQLVFVFARNVERLVNKCGRGFFWNHWSEVLRT